MATDTIKTIVFATDFSTGAAKATNIAKIIAHLAHAKIHVINVMTLLETSIYWQTPLLSAGVDQARLDNEIRAQAQKELLKFMDKHFTAKEGEKPIETQAHLVIHSVPYEAIISEAERLHAQLIVMGTHGRSGVARALAGSTAERVVRHSPIPVLTTRG